MVAYVKRNLSTLNFFTHRQDDLVKIKVTGMESKELGDIDFSNIINLKSNRFLKIIIL
jgi:hypothetical protein